MLINSDFRKFGFDGPEVSPFTDSINHWKKDNMEIIYRNDGLLRVYCNNIDVIYNFDKDPPEKGEYIKSPGEFYHLLVTLKIIKNGLHDTKEGL